MKILEAITSALNIVKLEAHSRTDGNTEALVEKILRDVNTLLPEYQTLTFEEVYSREENDPSFVPASYEKTGAQDVNTEPLASTGEELKNADNPEKEPTTTAKQGKVSKTLP